MARVDLEKLERAARRTHDLAAVLEARPTHMTNQHDHAMAAWDYYVAAKPSVMLALIARIRELEAALGETAGAFEATSDTRRRSEYADELRALLDKGAVIE